MCDEDQNGPDSMKILTNQFNEAQIQNAFNDVQQNFMEYYNKKEYLKFDFDTLRQILSSDNLNVESEEIVFKTVKKWLMEKQLSPERHLHILLDVVRLPLLSTEYLWKQAETYAITDLKCVPMFLEAIKYHLFPDRMSEMKLKERKVYRKFLSVGSWVMETCGIVELYDTCLDKWIHLKNLNLNRRDFAAVVLNDKLMIMGGHLNTGGITYNTVEFYDLLTGRLTAGPPMLVNRCNCSAFVIDENSIPIVYIIGGYPQTNTAEKYDSMTNKWTALPTMLATRDGGGCDFLDGKIYVAGGRHGSILHNSMEVFDIKRNVWEMKATMIRIRSYCRIVSTRRFIYAMGGYPDGFQVNPYNFVERYDPKTNSWMSVASITSSGLGGLCSYGTFKNKILFVGGANSSKITEEYDEDRNEWKSLAPLNFGREGATVVEIPQKFYHCKIQW